MNPRTGIASRLVALFALGAALFNYPLLALFDRAAAAFGIPVLYVYIFCAWALLIALFALVIERPR
jgi:predicted permease